MRGGQACERRTILNPPVVERLSQVFTGDGVRVRSQQPVDVVGSGRRVDTAVQFGGGAAHEVTVAGGLHHEVDDFGRRDSGDRRHRGVLVEQQHLLEGDVAYLGLLAEYRAPDGQCHLAVRGTGKRRHVVDLVVIEPGLGQQSDVCLFM